MKVGQKVKGSHGLGTIVALNKRVPHTYVVGKLGDAIALTSGDVGLSNAIVDEFYTADKYPYIVKFEDGYQDVYAESDLEAV